MPPRKLAMVKERIEADLVAGARPGDLAAVAGLSPEPLRRCFREETDLTPHQYQTRRRIEEVTRLLDDPGVSPAQAAAAAAGFSSQSHSPVRSEASRVPPPRGGGEGAAD